DVADRSPEEGKVLGSPADSSASERIERRREVKRWFAGRSTISLILILLVCTAFYGQDAASSDPVMRAMSDELKRSVSELQFKDLDKPYFIQYIVIDQEEYRVSATFGALTASDLNRARYLQAQVRVGDYDFDNSEFVTGPGFQGAPPAGVTTQTVVDNDYDAIRHSLWLATDAAYKQS